MRTLTLIVLICLTVVGPLGCRRTTPAKTVTSPDGTMVFRAFANQNKSDRRWGCVKIEVVDTAGRVIFSEQTNASDSQRWSIWWIGNDQIELDSSDIGLLTWRRIDDRWQQTENFVSDESKPWWDTETGEEANEILRGVIERRPWAKSGESWEAGGSEYHVVILATGSSTILRPSDDVGVDALTEFEGKRVELSGCHLKPAPWQPSDPRYQYPLGVTSRGGGFKVKTIEPLQ